MQCARCGAQLVPTMAFCGSCGTPVGAAATGVLKRPAIISLLAVLQVIGGVFWLLIALVMIGASITTIRQGQSDGVFMLIFSLVLGGIGAAQLACGTGLWTLKRRGLTLQRVFAYIGLLGIPFGTIISILILVYLNKPGIQVLFSGQQASQLNAEEWAQVAAVSSTSGAMVAVIAIVVVVLGVITLSIASAIAIPGLLRARMSGNEASAIGSLRAITSGEAAYASSCGAGGYAVTLADLAKPPQGGGAGYLPPDLGTNGVVKSGYVIALEKEAGPFVADVAAAAATCNGSTSPTAASYFASADPVTPGSTGRRYFATDARGVVYQSNGRITNPIVPSATVVPIQ